jgi:exopolysaccharide production protein ExoZ
MPNDSQGAQLADPPRPAERAEPGHDTGVSEDVAVVEPTERPRETERIYSLQWLRFAAAGAVLLYHASAHLQLVRGADWAFTYVPHWLGAVGVALFFALSGYLMSSAMNRYSAGQFLLHRVVRIYPTYFMVAGLAVVAGLFTSISLPLDWNALSLLPYGASSYPLGVEWSLVFEIAFYVFVASLILLKRQKSAATVLIGWLGLMFIHNLVSPDNPAVNVFPARELMFVGVNTGFAFGMLLPLLKIRTLHPVVAAIAAYAAMTWGSMHGIMWSRWGVGLGCAYLVLSAARFRGWRAVFGNTRLGRLGNRLGNSSYALYLCHVPILRTVYITLPNVGIVRCFALGIVLSLVAALVVGEIDVRIYRVLKRLVDRSSRRAVTIAATVFVVAFVVACVRFF